MILRTDGENGKEDSEPGSRDGPGDPSRCSGVLGPLLKIDHQSRLEIANVNDEAPKWLGDLFVGAKESRQVISVRTELDGTRDRHRQARRARSEVDRI